MVKKYNLPTNEQLVELSTKINEILSDVKTENMKIWFQLDEENLRRIDEEYFFKYNKDANEKDFVHGDEVVLNLLGVNIIFTAKDFPETIKEVEKKEGFFKKLIKKINV